MLPPVIVIPGVTATSLTDFYPSAPEGRWGMLGKDYERVTLHPDDLRFEQIEPAQIRPGEAFSIPYDEYVRELRNDLSPAHDEPRPVFLFNHDWRQPIEVISADLARFVDEVAGRTALLRHYAKSGYTADAGRVDLVGHSMGGLVICGYLVAAGAAHRARKVITLGTPFGGSFEAVLKIIVGTSGLDSGVPKARERMTARVTPALYHLLPKDGRHLSVEHGPSDLPRSLFDAALWQHNVLETLAEYIEIYSNEAASTKAGRRLQAEQLLQKMLDRAGKFLKGVEALSIDALGIGVDDWMAIVGVGEETRVHLKIDDMGKTKGPWYDLTSLHRKNGYPMPVVAETGQVVAEVWDTGDGTVPYFGAEPPFLSPSKLIGVSSEDFGYWELADRFLEWRTNLHSMLPSMNRVIKLSVRFLEAGTGEKARGYPGIRGRRAPGCVRDGLDWDPPFVNLREERPEGWGGLMGPGT